MTVYLEVDDLVEIAAVILRTTPPIRDAGLLAAAAARPSTVAFDTEVYPDVWSKAAALMHSV
ncbi:hypothetical protein [Plantactinospora sp. KBS50]|uniref:hypothetical protein n=1 Tax=Plantactinospora sp. KBS50 TaxID=2024580 RepID=UPI000BAADC71|nr:hypothetical protein [Plantactinospora sp. KBS50]ASW56035.1 hypothetical protein CIK06_20420 [Plantactinospora sp. KBS50]